MDVNSKVLSSSVNSVSPQIVLVFDGGGLCNRIFPFANALAAAAEHGCQVVNPVLGRYAEYFCGTATSDVTELLTGGKMPLSILRLPFWEQRFALARIIRPSSVISGGDSNVIDLEQLLTKQVTDSRLWINGLYCLACDSFVKHADFLRIFFRPVDMIRDEVDRYIDAARIGSDVLVGVHIRQGDYAQHDGGMLFYETPEYVALMRQIQELIPSKNVRFLVCSNVSQSKEDLGGIDWRPGPGAEISDLYALAACDYIIGPPSTYSQWASFYGKVPRYVHNRKYEEKNYTYRTKLGISSFNIHQKGFGRFEGDSF